MIAKIWGKIFSYLGILMGVAGLLWENLPFFGVGVFILIIGCIVHELAEVVEKND